MEIITWIISLADLISSREKTDQTHWQAEELDKAREISATKKEAFSRNEAVISQRFGIMEEEEYDDFNFT